jgi:hypothetical protein
MPAINVARTDTFEVQRQKINQIGDILSNISAGGSDLQTGNLKLGDGTIAVPSLSFISDSELGLIKSKEKTIEFVSGGKKIWDFSEEDIVSYKDVSFLKEVLVTDGLSINSGGTNYDAGSYTDINIIGGTGVDGLINLTVTAYTGTITNSGENYQPGIYNQILLSGGSGTGSTVDITIEDIQGEVTNGGSGYKPGLYVDVPLTNGSGSGALADVEIQGSADITGTITNAGGNYDPGTYEGTTVLNQPTQTYTVTAVTNPSAPPTDLFAIGGVNQQALTLIGGNTYKFDISDPSMSGYNFGFRTLTGDTNLDPLQYVATTKGGGGGTNAAVYLTVKPGASDQIEYYAIEEDGMGATVSFTTGAQTNFGSGGLATVTVDTNGAVTGFVWEDTGTGYDVGDVLELSPYDLGFNTAGTGFTYSISNITYNGTVFNVSVTNIGQNYINGDILGVNDASVGGGGGNGFAFEVQTNPGKVSEITFNEKGEGYQPNDILTLPTGVTGKTTNLSGSVTGVSTTLTSGVGQITVASTSGIIAGMAVTVDPGGDGDLDFSTVVQSVNSSTTLTLNPAPIASGSAVINFQGPGSLTEIIVDSLEGILTNSIVTQTAGTGSLPAGTTVIALNDTNNTVTLSEPPTLAGTATLDFLPPYGSPTVGFEFTIDTIGVVEGFGISDGGIGYSLDDTITVNPTSLTQPITYDVSVLTGKIVSFTGNVSSSAIVVGDEMTTTGGGFGDPETSSVYYVNSTGGVINYIIIGNVALSAGDTLQNERTSSIYTTNSVEEQQRFLFDGEILSSPTTFYVGNTYVFTTTDDTYTGHELKFSKFADGPYSPSLVEVTATYVSGNPQITVPSTTGIFEGMAVNITDFQSEVVLAGAFVESVDSATQITLTANPSGSGSASTSFVGVPYEDGIVSSSAEISITITEETPDLYIYCTNHPDMMGEDGEEILFSVNPNNPKVFGSGFSLNVEELDVSTPIDINIKEGKITLIDLTASDAQLDTLVAETSISAPTINSTDISLKTISSSDQITTTTVNGYVLRSNLSVEDSNQNTFLTVDRTNGNLLSLGEIKSALSFNSNEKLFIQNEVISSASNTDIKLTPALNRIVKVDTNTALIIPSGNNDQRPLGTGVAENGAIRFNTESQQYEGYSENTDSWSSLGGVRDLDGNTTILAEETIGKNDNTLWFINDNINTLKFTPQYQEFVNVKKIRSLNTSAPPYQEWTANTPVSTGQYLKYRNNIFLVVSVTGDGSTASSGSEPTNVTGDDFTHGNTVLRYFTSAVASLTYEEISEVRIDPLGFTDLVVNNELRFSNNKISSTNNDIIIEPTGTQKTVIKGTSSLVVPVGDNNSKGNPARGSIRYSTTDAQFEGFNGTQWGGLGGVKDIDQDTKIEAETAPGNDEDILYFFNAGNNTLRLSTTQLEFDSIDTIVSTDTGILNINAATVTFDSLATTINNSESTRTFISTSKDNLDFGLSTGLNNDHLLRLKDTGEVVFNLGFGTGTPDNLTVLNSTLTNFELKHTRVSTSKIPLVRGTLNSGNSAIYSTSTEASAKVCLTAHNTTTGDKELIEYYITNNGTDVYFTDYGNVKTGADLVSTVFDIDPSNNVRITFTLNTNLTVGDNVSVTLIKTVTKR